MGESPLALFLLGRSQINFLHLLKYQKLGLPHPFPACKFGDGNRREYETLVLNILARGFFFNAGQTSGVFFLRQTKKQKGRTSRPSFY